MSIRKEMNQNNISLREVDASNWREVLTLNPGANDYVEPVHHCLLETVFHVASVATVGDYVKAIYLDDTLVGHCEFYPTHADTLYILCFMLDEKYHGLGYGKRAFTELMHYWRVHLNARQIELSTRNPIARRLYESFGFRALDNDRAREYFATYHEVLLTAIL